MQSIRIERSTLHFKGFIHWNPADSAVFQKGYNRICADSDEEHFQVDLRVDPQSNPAGNAGQHHLPEHHTHNRFLNRQAQQEADYNHNRCGPNVQFADFTVCIKAIASVIHGSTYIFHYRVSQNITDNCANQGDDNRKCHVLPDEFFFDPEIPVFNIVLLKTLIVGLKHTDVCHEKSVPATVS